MSSEPNAERALAKLCEQARAVIDPKLDARAMEAAVLEQVSRGGAESKFVARGKPRRTLLLAAFLAAGAAAFAFIGWKAVDHARRSGATAARAELQRDDSLDAGQLGLGQLITASERDVTVKHGNLATWRLTAPGVARILENDARITIALAQGRIDASVTPQAKPDAFAVEVEDVRVAVHGTVFSVRRREGFADIHVREGAVLVGARGRSGSVERRLLAAPEKLTVAMQANSSTDAAPDLRTQPKAAPPAFGRRNASEPTNARDSEPSTPLPERPSAAEIEQIWDAAMRRVSDCFAAQTGADPNLRVSFGTNVGLRIAPDGTVSLTEFNPPVPRDVFDCAQRDVMLMRVTPSELGASSSRARVLTR